MSGRRKRRPFFSGPFSLSWVGLYLMKTNEPQKQPSSSAMANQLAGNQGISRPAPPIQRQQTDAAAYIKDNDLQIAGDYENVLKYCRGKQHHPSLRKGLVEAWNKGKTGADADYIPEDIIITEVPDEKKGGREINRQAENMEAMLAGTVHALEKYTIPESLIPKPSAASEAMALRQRMFDFNTALLTMARTAFFKKAFTLTINVGDLDGFGDIAAAAKLATELSAFYRSIEHWREVNLRLYLIKLDKLGEKALAEKEKESKKAAAPAAAAGGRSGRLKKEVKGKKEKAPEAPAPKKESAEEQINKARAMALSLLAGAPVTLQDASPVEGPQVEFAYPADNVGGVDFTIAQYGYQQYGVPDASMYGSGPAPGSLGILPVPEDRQAMAESRAMNPAEGSLMYAVQHYKRTHGIQRFHFAYFSVYNQRPRDFVQAVVKAPGTKIAVAISRSADDLQHVANGLIDQGCSVVLTMMSKTGEITGNSHFPTRVIKSKKAAEPPYKGKEVWLLDLAQGVDNLDMLSLYFTSDAPVGATGDQSFMEAYMMRIRRNRAVRPAAGGMGSTSVTSTAIRSSPAVSSSSSSSSSASGGTDDILYDVTAQQGPLYQQLGQMEGSTANRGGERGLRPIKVFDHIAAGMTEKRLLFPVVMLINQALQDKAVLEQQRIAAEALPQAAAKD